MRVREGTLSQFIELRRDVASPSDDDRRMDACDIVQAQAPKLNRIECKPPITGNIVLPVPYLPDTRSDLRGKVSVFCHKLCARALQLNQFDECPARRHFENYEISYILPTKPKLGADKVSMRKLLPKYPWIIF